MTSILRSRLFCIRSNVIWKYIDVILLLQTKSYFKKVTTLHIK